jgi:chemotaxis protein MotB
MRRYIACVVFMSAAACGVPEAKYDAAVKSAENARASQEGAQKRIDELEKQNNDLRDQLTVAQGKATSDEDRAKLEELKKAQAEAAERAKDLSAIVDKFKQMVDAGTLKIITRHGRLVLQLQSDVLFDAFKTDIKPAGKKALVDIAQTLKTMPTRHFQVAGHTDVVPVHTKEFPSNWELSSARAIEVVKFLVTQGVSAPSLSAAGYALYDPVGTDAAKNRRIEITFVPSMEHLVSTAPPK